MHYQEPMKVRLHIICYSTSSIGNHGRHSEISPKFNVPLECLPGMTYTAVCKKRCLAIGAAPGLLRSCRLVENKFCWKNTVSNPVSQQTPLGSPPTPILFDNKSDQQSPQFPKQHHPSCHYKKRDVSRAFCLVPSPHCHGNLSSVLLGGP